MRCVDVDMCNFTSRFHAQKNKKCTNFRSKKSSTSDKSESVLIIACVMCLHVLNLLFLLHFKVDNDMNHQFFRSVNFQQHFLNYIPISEYKISKIFTYITCTSNMFFERYVVYKTTFVYVCEKCKLILGHILHLLACLNSRKK
jgi:hypothetical protein